MKKSLILSALLLVPLLFSCNKNKGIEPTVKPDLVIPQVDVESLQIDLPDKPTRYTDQANIRTDDTNDYIEFWELSDFHGAVNYSLEDNKIDTVGLAKLATFFENRRSYNKAGMILLSSGDMFQGSAESNLTRGYVVNYSLNYMGFEAMALGNHEFDWTDEWLRKNSNLEYNDYKIPYLGANIINKTTNDLPDFVKKSTIIQRGKYKIGVVGTIGDTLESSILKTCIENYEFTNELNAAKSEAAYLKNTENCDVIVWLSHNSVDDLATYNLTSEDNIDVVFGGHAHVSKNQTVNGIPILSSSYYGKSLAHVELAINKTSGEVSVEQNYYLDLTNDKYGVKDSIPNEDVESIIDQYNVEINKIKNIKLGHTNSELSNSNSGRLKNICTYAIQKSAKEYFADLGSNSEINPNDICASFHNVSGGIRASILKGDITYGDVYKPFPFDNEIVLVKMSGATLKSKYAMNSNFSYYATWHIFQNKSEIDNSKNYYIVLTDFLALSKLNYTDSQLIHTGLNVRDEIAKLIYSDDEIDINKYYGKNFIFFS